MFKLEKHPNGYASIIGHGLQSQDARTVSHAEGERLVATFDTVESGLREDLRVQIEAKCKALTRAQEAENIADELRRDIADLTEKRDALSTKLGKIRYLGNRMDNRYCDVVVDDVRYIRQSQVDTLTKKLEWSQAGTQLLTKKLNAKRETIGKLVTAIHESQKILADYLEPGKKLLENSSGQLCRDTISQLLEILDHRDLVTLVDGNSEEAKPGEPYLDMLSSKPTNWPYWATHLFRDEDGWQFGKLVKEGYFIDSDSEATASQCWNRQNMIDGTLEERPGHEGVTLKTATNAAGQEYICGLGVGVDPQQFIVEADKVYINGAAIETGTLVHTILDGFSKIISETQLGKMVTTNHFAPEPKASKKELKQLRKATEYFEQYADAHPNPLPENTKAAKHLRKLLRKLS